MTLGALGRRACNRILRTRGYELRRLGSPVRGFPNFVDMLHAYGFQPGTVIDVGVCNGTPWLYRFPSAKLVLVEANPRFAPVLTQLAMEHGADVLQHAVGSAPGVVTLHVDDTQPGSASVRPLSGFIHKARGRERSVHRVDVPMTTLDALVGDRYPGRYLLKLDIEGYELDALKGAAATLANTDLIISECSVAPRFDGGYGFADLVGLLAGHGFRLYDVPAMATLGQGGPINYIDAAFIREGVSWTARPR